MLYDHCIKSDTPNSMVCPPSFQQNFSPDEKTLADNEKLRFVFKTTFVDEIYDFYIMFSKTVGGEVKTRT